jgi:uncharacterized membrane protein
MRRFFIYGFTGLMMEVIWTGILSFLRFDFTLECQTSLLMLPVYGLAVMLEPFFEYFTKTGVSAVVRGAAYAVLIFFAEYSTGGIYTLLGICPWNYVGANFNVNGLIRLDYAPLWAMAGLMFEKLYFLLGKNGIKNTKSGKNR